MKVVPVMTSPDQELSLKTRSRPRTTPINAPVLHGHTPATDTRSSYATGVYSAHAVQSLSMKSESRITSTRRRDSNRNCSPLTLFSTIGTRRGAGVRALERVLRSTICHALCRAPCTLKINFWHFKQLGGDLVCKCVWKCDLVGLVDTSSVMVAKIVQVQCCAY